MTSHRASIDYAINELIPQTISYLYNANLDINNNIKK